MQDISKRFGSRVADSYYLHLHQIKVALYSKGYSLAECARALNIDPGNFSRYLNGTILMPYSVKLAIDWFLEDASL